MSNLLNKSSVSFVTEDQHTDSSLDFSDSNESLNTIESQVLKNILKETLDKLAIINRDNVFKKQSINTKLPMKIRYRESREKLFHEDTLEPIDIAMNRMLFVKLSSDISRLQKIIGSTVDDLNISPNNFKSLNAFIYNEQRLEMEEKNLIHQNYKYDMIYKFLEKQFDDDQIMYKNKIKQADDCIAEIEDELADLRNENKSKLNLLIEWEKTRFGQIKFLTESKEHKLIIESKNYKKDFIRELRLKHEIETFLENQTTHYDQLTQQWKQKYQEEIIRLDREIMITKNKTKALEQEYNKYHQLFNANEEEINLYLDDKKQRQYAIDLAEKQYDSVIKLQAWWRGLLVRRGLLAFKRKKSKKTKPPKKGKKK